MRALFSLLLVLILIPLIVLGGALALLYFTYFDVQPAQYSFAHQESEIESIEYAKFSFTEQGLTPDKVGLILDTKGFMTELKATDCHSGMEINAFIDLINGAPIQGVIINYTDGSFDFITPYICVSSSNVPKTLTDLLNTKIYGFNEAAFAELLDKYGVELPEEVMDGLENVENLEDYLKEHPELVPQN